MDQYHKMVIELGPNTFNLTILIQNHYHKFLLQIEST